jgi:MSHA biogenesis protein MshK
MAERLSRGLAGLALAAATAVVAQSAGLSDPTRPPDAATAAPPSQDATGSAAAAPRLLSVLISPNRKLAVIDGRTVVLGERVGDATLVQITETQVTLRRGAELTTLELYPGVVRRATPTIAGRHGKP